MSKEETFINAIKENEGIIYKVTSVYTNSRDEQKDLYQEIVYQLWKSFDSFKGKSKFSTWMYRVALNTSIAHITKGKKRINQTTMDFQLLNIAEEEDTVMAERLSILHSHIKLLNAVEKGLILLFLEGKSHEEIATITGFSKTNVGTRIGRIKNKLKFQINR